MQVRYQAAPRSDSIILLRFQARRIARSGTPREALIIRRFRVPRCDSLAPQHLQQLLQFEPHLLHNLLALAHIRACFLASELLTRTADREALLVEQAADLPDDNHVLALVVTPVATTFHGLELWKLLLPVAQYVRLDAAQLTHFTDGEVALARNRRQLGVILWLQHRLRPVLSAFDRDGTSPLDGR